MRSPVERWRQQQARRRYMPHMERSKTGITAKIALGVLVLIVLAAALLELRRGGGGAEGAFVEHARENALDPLDLVEVAGRSRRLVFLADVTSAAAPKRFAARAVERLASGPGLDLVVLNVPADEQPFIDQYLATTPEDASLLLARPRAIREGDGASREFIDLYRAIWRVNAGMGAHRRIRIVAADHPGWPPARAVSPHEAARLFGERDAHMLDAVTGRALGRSPNARVLFFVDGLHALKSGGGRVLSGGSTPVEVTWLAARLAERYGGDVFSILVDAVPSRVITTDAAAYGGTRLGVPLQRAGVPNGIALRSAPPLDEVSRTPIRVVGTTGVEFMLEPRATAFSRLADAYIYFGS
jgi:hypothetical protein